MVVETVEFGLQGVEDGMLPLHREHRHLWEDQAGVGASHLRNGRAGIAAGESSP